MSGKERREQLIQISRTLFAEKGFDGTSVEEIAATANVSKPVVYEHFGGKEGVYAVVIDREMQKLLIMVTEALSASHSLIKLERAALALLAYVEENSEGFRILVRDSHAASGTGTFASLINDIASQVEDVMVDEFVERGYDPKLAPMYAQMLVGMVALTGQWWLDVRKPSREEVAAHLVNLAWNGLTGLDPSPRLTASSRGLGQRLAQAPQRTADAAPIPRDRGGARSPAPPNRHRPRRKRSSGSWRRHVRGSRRNRRSCASANSARPRSWPGSWRRHGSASSGSWRRRVSGSRGSWRRRCSARPRPPSARLSSERNSWLKNKKNLSQVGKQQRSLSRN